MNTALQYALGESVNTQAIAQAIQDKQVQGELIPLDVNHPTQGACFTTRQLIDCEQRIIQAVSKIHPSKEPLLSEPKLQAFLAVETDFNHEQRQAIQVLFSSHHQIMALEGATGSGKTSLFKPLLELIKLGGYQGVVLKRLIK
jgi:predicted ribonuclease YlaK